MSRCWLLMMFTSCKWCPIAVVFEVFQDYFTAPIRSYSTLWMTTPTQNKLILSVKIGTRLSRPVVVQMLMQNLFRPEENEALDTLSRVSTLNTCHRFHAKTFAKMCILSYFIKKQRAAFIQRLSALRPSYHLTIPLLNCHKLLSDPSFSYLSVSLSSSLRPALNIFLSTQLFPPMTALICLLQSLALTAVGCTSNI